MSFSITIQSRLTHFLSVWDTIVSEYASKYHHLSLIPTQHAAIIIIIIVICWYYGKKIHWKSTVFKRKRKNMCDRTGRHLFLIIDAIDVGIEEYSITKLKIISNVNKDCLPPICICAFILILALLATLFAFVLIRISIAVLIETSNRWRKRFHRSRGHPVLCLTSFFKLKNTTYQTVSTPLQSVNFPVDIPSSPS